MKKTTVNRLIIFFALFLSLCLNAQSSYKESGAGNPIIPGYFADPTIKKFGDTYYIYATTDGSGAGFGPAQVWSSNDFVNWTLTPMNWPDSHWIWAPDVLQHSDGKYYYFYCQPCIIHCGVSDTPRGPWTNILGESESVLVPDRFVENAITLDGQTFVDDDGSVYLYWGTWGIFKGFGCGAGKMTEDLKGFTETRLIPNTEVTDFFEAPFVLKRKGIYYLMYSSGSCHDHTYRVQYATSANPLGPYEYKGCILETNADSTVHGPGHHSILQEGDDYYMVYHRHDNPHSNRGFHRQICIDPMFFENDGNIRKIEPSHHGIGLLAPSSIKSENIALNCKVRASSFYDENFLPEYAIDNNNGTQWKPLGTGQEWIELDLGKIRKINSIWTQFEYGTAFYQYIIETSKDGKHWEIFSDKRNNYLAGSPMVDFGNNKGRYIRLTTTGKQKNGFRGAIWNIKVFEENETACPQQWLGLTAADWNGREWENNGGMLGGSFIIKEGNAIIQRIDGREALVLEPGTILQYKNELISSDKPHSFTALAFQNGEWGSFETTSCLGKGVIEINSGNNPLPLTNLRYYNWKQTQAERDYDLNADIVRLPAVPSSKKGLIVDITANDFEIGDTVHYIPNHGLQGIFEYINEPLIVELQNEIKAFRFDSLQVFQSDFSLPLSLSDNASYTLEAMILNPKMSLNECVADFTTTHNELEKIMLVNGTEPRCGIINHYGWYEDAGHPDAKKYEGIWQHVYICFDGRIERVYINDELISEKDIQLLIKPSQYITLGRNAEKEWPFKGYLHSLKLWDEYKPYK